MKERQREKLVSVYVLLVIGLVLTNLPIIWLFLCSIKPEVDIISGPKWVFSPTLRNYLDLFRRSGDFDFVKCFVNSCIITGVTTLISLLISFPAAYSMARYKTGGDNYSFWVLSIRMMPPVVFLIPISVLFSAYRLTDTHVGVIMAYLTFNIPFATWIMKSFIEDIPVELEMSAYIDGYSQLDMMRKIVFPLFRPAVIAVGIICFIFSWNEFMYALVITFWNSSTLTVGAAKFITGYGIQWGRIAAATMVAIVPTLIIGYLGQRYLVRGLTMGAVK